MIERHIEHIHIHIVPPQLLCYYELLFAASLCKGSTLVNNI